MNKKAQSQFLAGAIIGAAAVYLIARRDAVGPISYEGENMPAPLPQLPQLSGQYSRNAAWYGVGAYPMSPQRLYRPLAPPANYFI